MSGHLPVSCPPARDTEPSPCSPAARRVADALARVQAAHETTQERAAGAISGGRMKMLEERGLVVVDLVELEELRAKAHRWDAHVAACQADDEHRAPAARGSVTP